VTTARDMNRGWRVVARKGAVNEPSELRAEDDGPVQPAPAPETASERATGAEPGTGHRRWVSRAQQYRHDLEQRPRVGFLLRSIQRFNAIEGKHLALVIAANMFVAIIPLLILGYAFLEAFNPHRSFGVVLVNAFHLSGNTARTVQDTFTNAKSGKNTALSIGLISLLVTGFDISATVQLAYARAFEVTPMKGTHKYVRGAVWLVVLLAVSGGGLTIRYLVFSRPWWFLVLLIPGYLLMQFGFFIVTPRLLLDLPFAWRDLVPGAGISTIAAVIVVGVSSFELHRWVRAYGQAYGGFGIALSIIAYVGLLALFWVWVAAVMGAYWERKAGSSAVAAMQQLSADVTRS
jgi:uncharacterized BrkB/YihY/UPF0761 family membrane protein